jgi:hypothetical protein
VQYDAYTLLWSYNGGQPKKKKTASDSKDSFSFTVSEVVQTENSCEVVERLVGSLPVVDGDRCVQLMALEGWGRFMGRCFRHAESPDCVHDTARAFKDVILKQLRRNLAAGPAACGAASTAVATHSLLALSALVVESMGALHTTFHVRQGSISFDRHLALSMDLFSEMLKVVESLSGAAGNRGILLARELGLLALAQCAGVVLTDAAAFKRLSVLTTVDTTSLHAHPPFVPIYALGVLASSLARFAKGGFGAAHFQTAKRAFEGIVEVLVTGVLLERVMGEKALRGQGGKLKVFLLGGREAAYTGDDLKNPVTLADILGESSMWASNVQSGRSDGGGTTKSNSLFEVCMLTIASVSHSLFSMNMGDQASKLMALLTAWRAGDAARKSSRPMPLLNYALLELAGQCFTHNLLHSDGLRDLLVDLGSGLLAVGNGLDIVASTRLVEAAHNRGIRFTPAQVSDSVSDLTERSVAAFTPTHGSASDGSNSGFNDAYTCSLVGLCNLVGCIPFPVAGIENCRDATGFNDLSVEVGASLLKDTADAVRNASAAAKAEAKVAGAVPTARGVVAASLYGLLAGSFSENIVHKESVEINRMDLASNQLKSGSLSRYALKYLLSVDNEGAQIRAQAAARNHAGGPCSHKTMITVYLNALSDCKLPSCRYAPLLLDMIRGVGVGSPGCLDACLQFAFRHASEPASPDRSLSDLLLTLTTHSTFQIFGAAARSCLTDNFHTILHVIDEGAVHILLDTLMWHLESAVSKGGNAQAAALMQVVHCMTSCLRAEGILPSQRDAVEDFVISRLAPHFPATADLHNSMDTNPASEKLWSSVFALVQEVQRGKIDSFNAALYSENSRIAIPALCRLCESGFLPRSTLTSDNIALKSIQLNKTKGRDHNDLHNTYEVATQLGQTESHNDCIADLFGAWSTRDDVKPGPLLHMVAMILAKVLSSVNSSTVAQDGDSSETSKSSRVCPTSLCLFEGFPVTAAGSKEVITMPCARCVREVLVLSKRLSDAANNRNRHIGKLVWEKMLDMLESPFSNDMPLSSPQVLGFYRCHDVSPADFQRVRRAVFRSTSPLLV